MTTNDDDGAVGYGRPPRYSQFQKGRSGNPHGRPRKKASADIDVGAILEMPVPTMLGGKQVLMAPKELELRQALKKAMAGDLTPLAYLFDQFSKYGALPALKQGGGVITLPTNDMPAEMADWLLFNVSVPPWSPRDIARGRTHYLKTRSEENRWWDERFHYPALEDPNYRMTWPDDRSADRGKRKGSRNLKTIVADVAQERHRSTVDGEERYLTTIELLLHVLNRKRLEGDIRAAKLLDKRCQSFLDPGLTKTGCLVLPETQTIEGYARYIELVNELNERWPPPWRRDK